MSRAHTADHVHRQQTERRLLRMPIADTGRTWGEALRRAVIGGAVFLPLLAAYLILGG